MYASEIYIVPFMLFFGGISLLAGLYLWVRNNSDRYNMDGVFGAVWVGVALVLLLLSAGVMYPYDMDYHQYSIKEGTVVQIDSRMVPAGKGMEEKFAVELSDGGVYGCLDTRCSLLEPGDTLTMACKKVWEFRGTAGWDCKFRHMTLQ